MTHPMSERLRKAFPCGFCSGTGVVTGVGTEAGHAPNCDGSCVHCPVPIAVQIQEQCENCEGTGCELGILVDAASELDRLNAIVERLPLTADGVPVVPGETQWAVFCYDRDDPDEPLRVSACNYVGNASDWTDGIKWEIEDCGDCRCEVIGVYSTREAAEAAKEARDDK